MSRAYIVDAVRTPVGKFGGGLSSVRPDDLAALCIKEILNRNPSVDPAQIEDVILGNTNQAGEDNRNIARMSLLLAGLPVSVPGITVNRLCASGMSAVATAARGVKLGEGDLYIAGGVESMSRAPYVQAKPETAFSRFPKIYDTSIGWRFPNPKLDELYGTEGMGQTAENVANDFNVSREDQDKFALWSQSKAEAAQQADRFQREIISVEIPQRKGDPIIVSKDEHPRHGLTIGSLSKLKPVFAKDGSVTAGNASGINDGAGVLLIASEKAVKELKLEPIAHVVEATAVGLEPRIMGMGPLHATKKILDRTQIKLDDLSVIELNEAFSSQTLACMRELGLSDDDKRVNPNGGAIALGHPLGMSGARIIQTAAEQLKASNGKYALCTMCIGVGQGMATIIERV